MSDEDLFDVFNDAADPNPITSSPSPTTAPIAPQRATDSPRSSTTHGEYKNESTPARPTPTPPAASPAAPQGMMMVLSSHGSSPESREGAFPATNPKEVLREAYSGLYVRRVTRSFHLMPVVAAQYPYVAFSVALQSLRHKPQEPLERCCVGVVCRKSDPKQGSHGAYGVVTLWNMEGLSPSASCELAFLVCGTAFQRLYNQLCLGLVVSVASLQRLTGSSSDAAGKNKGSGGDSLLLRLEDPGNAHLLGASPHFGTCEAVHQQTGERCKSLINTSLTKFCVYHVRQKHTTANKLSSASGHSKSMGAAASLATAGTTTTTSRVVGRGARSIIPGAEGAPTALFHASKRIPAAPLFTVSSKTGLPSMSASNAGVAHRLQGCTAGGVYSAVKGQPLPVSRTVAAHPQTYPSSSALRVSSRGRATLEAAIQIEQTRALSQVLHRAQNGAPVTVPAAAESQNVPLAAGPGKRPREASSSDTGPQEQRGRPGAVPASAVEMAERIKKSFSPLTRTGANNRFQPLHCFGQSGTGAQERRVASAAAAQRAPSALLQTVAAQVAQQARAEKGPKASLRDLLPSDSDPQELNGKSMLVAMAERLDTSQSALVMEAGLEKVQKELEKITSIEAARQALEQITEEDVRADFCCQCHRWYNRAPDSCKNAGHRVERRSTKKYYVQCGDCAFKTFVLGERHMTLKVLPRCPRCNSDTAWRQGNAAPELAAPSKRTIESQGAGV